MPCVASHFSHYHLEDPGGLVGHNKSRHWCTAAIRNGQSLKKLDSNLIHIKK